MVGFYFPYGIGLSAVLELAAKFKGEDKDIQQEHLTEYGYGLLGALIDLIDKEYCRYYTAQKLPPFSCAEAPGASDITTTSSLKSEKLCKEARECFKQALSRRALDGSLRSGADELDKHLQEYDGTAALADADADANADANAGAVLSMRSLWQEMVFGLLVNGVLEAMWQVLGAADKALFNDKYRTVFQVNSSLFLRSFLNEINKKPDLSAIK